MWRDRHRISSVRSACCRRLGFLPSTKPSTSAFRNRLPSSLSTQVFPLPVQDALTYTVPAFLQTTCALQRSTFTGASTEAFLRPSCLKCTFLVAKPPRLEITSPFFLL